MKPLFNILTVSCVKLIAIVYHKGKKISNKTERIKQIDTNSRSDSQIKLYKGFIAVR